MVYNKMMKMSPIQKADKKANKTECEGQVKVTVCCEEYFAGSFLMPDPNMFIY